MIKVILWDIDGTLLNFEEAEKHAIRACFAQFGLGESMNMFFVGPGNSPIIVFKQFSEWLGWYINTPIYIFAVCLGAFILFVLIYWIQNKELPFRKKQTVSKA